MGTLVEDSMQRHSACRWLARCAVLAIVVMTSACNTPPPVPLPPPPTNSWLVLLCQPSDDPSEPHPPAYYEAMFARGNADLLWDWFHEVSRGGVDISGSRVLGWFRMGVDKATLLARNNSTAVKRSQTAKDCRAAAVAALAQRGLTVDMNAYQGVITAMNVYADSGQAGARDLVINQDHPRTEIGFIVHEMLHVMGLPHSFLAPMPTGPGFTWQSVGFTEYNDCSDMMSFRTCVLGFQSSRGFQGPGLNAGYLDRLGWMPAHRKLLLGSGDRATSATLQALGGPSPGGHLMARVGLFNGGAYLVEYREPVRFDRGITDAGVQIRQQMPSGQTVLIQKRNGSGTWHAGESFTDAPNAVSIRVIAVRPGSADVQIDPSLASGGLALGEICGNRSQGQTAACVPSASCVPRRLGNQLQTVDWFCQ